MGKEKCCNCYRSNYILAQPTASNLISGEVLSLCQQFGLLVFG